MTAPDTIAPTAPPSPAEAPAPGPMKLGIIFFLLIGFGVLCVLGGAAFAAFGPMFFPHKTAVAARPAATAGVATPAPIASIDARLADIQARLAAAPATAPAVATPQLNALADRVDRLEAGQQRLVDAAAGALAAASLSQAAETSRPFAGELGALDAALPDSVDVRALRSLAETGAPTVAALAAQFPDLAARAAIASRARATGSGFWARLAQALAAIVTVRRTDRLDGAGADAVLARAGRRIEDGDLAGADAELDALPQAGRDVAEPWRKAARRRLEIDRRTQAIRAAALAELVRAAGPLRAGQPSAIAPIAPAAPSGALQGPPA